MSSTPRLAIPEEGAEAKKWATAWKLKDEKVELWQKGGAAPRLGVPLLGPVVG
jgi:hypothetical protein